MNILNIRRCSRCLASKREHVILDFRDDGNGKMTDIKYANWLFCFKYETLCASVAGFVCKESPMGISAEDYAKLNINKERRE